MPKLINLLGQKFGKLTVVAFHGQDAKGNSLWLCKCDCGNDYIGVGAQIKRLHSKSCGCIQVSAAQEASRTHGMTGTPTYQSWLNLKTRCLNPNREQWNDYGGRGITVCQRWLDSFEAFYADVGERPSVQHTIERKDTNGNYEPGNCVWATRQEQNRNRRDNRKITVDGVTKCAAQWAEEKGINVETLVKRVQVGTSEKDLFDPPGVLLTYQGKTLRAYEWAKLLGIPKPTICQRLKRGLPVEKVLHVGKHKTGPK